MRWTNSYMYLPSLFCQGHFLFWGNAETLGGREIVLYILYKHCLSSPYIYGDFVTEKPKFYELNVRLLTSNFFFIELLNEFVNSKHFELRIFIFSLVKVFHLNNTQIVYYTALSPPFTRYFWLPRSKKNSINALLLVFLNSSVYAVLCR